MKKSVIIFLFPLCLGAVFSCTLHGQPFINTATNEEIQAIGISKEQADAVVKSVDAFGPIDDIEDLEDSGEVTSETVQQLIEDSKVELDRISK